MGAGRAIIAKGGISYTFSMSLVLNGKTFDFALKDPAENGFYAPYSELFESCFGKRAHLDRRWYAWFNLDAPGGKNRVYLLTDPQAGGRFAASYALLPIEVVFGARRYPASLSVNGMTHPDYARQGLYSEVIARALKRQQELGCRISLSFPTSANVNSTKGHLKIGWRRLAPLHFFSKPLSGPERKSAPRASALDRFDPSHDARIEAFLRKYEFHLTRSSRFLNWRFVERPHVKYHILGLQDGGVFSGYAVCKLFEDPLKKETRLHIVDFAYDEPRHLEELLQAAENLAAEKRAGLVDLWHFDAASPELALLKARGFGRTERLNEVLVFSDVDFRGARFSDWHLVLGDNDVY